MLSLKVRKFGNSLGVILPKVVVQRLGSGVGQSLCLSESENGAYLLRRRVSRFEQKTNKAEDIVNRYKGTLKALSKSRAAKA